jgi:hypothetical protein
MQARVDHHPRTASIIASLPLAIAMMYHLAYTGAPTQNPPVD